MAIVDRVRRMWNAFVSNEEQAPITRDYGTTSSYSPSIPHRQRLATYNDRSIITSICTRISIDVADVLLRHVELDEFGRYLKDVDSQLNYCLTWEPNSDQGPRSFRQDVVRTLLGTGVAAIVPVDTTVNPETNEIFDILSLRVGDVKQWYHPDHVRVDLWNEAAGRRQEVVLEKRYVGIVENPLYSVMNDENSTFKRLTRKLTLLDIVDEQSSSGKLDIIIQLPYTIKSDTKRAAAEQRRTDIEMQLKGSQYGIAYADATEKIVQLNRPAENNLLAQVEYLTSMLYAQLGITDEVMNGTADDKTMLNYQNRTIKPIVESIVEAMQKAFLGPLGQDRNERILYFIDPFKLVTVKDLAEIGDKFSRNEILTPNEIRGFIGVRPSANPKADELQNSNMPQPGVKVEFGSGFKETTENPQNQNHTAANGRQTS